MIQAVIFDMDGTILNTLDDLYESVNLTLANFGFKVKTFDEVRRFVGNGVRLLFKRALPDDIDDETLEKCISYFKKIYAENMYNHTAPYNGIIKLLKELKSNGIKIAVVSNKFDLAVKELSKKFFENLIDISIGQADDVPPKPAPNGVFKAMKILNVKSAIFIGDSDVDIETAKNANLPSIGVTWGFRDRENLQGADYIADYPEEINKIIKSL